MLVIPASSPVGGGGAAALNTVTFDGANDYLTRGGNLTGVVDGKLGIFSVWLKPNIVSNDEFFSLRASGAGWKIKFQLLSTSRKWQMQLKNTSGTKILDLTSTIGLTLGSWQHLFASWDMNTTPKAFMYIDGIDRKSSTITTAGTLDYTSVDWQIGGRNSPQYDGCMAQLYFNSTEFIDPSVGNNIYKFYKAGSGTPDGAVDMGSNGSTPTGTQPIIYLENPLATWQDNLGSGGNFTENGALTSC